MNFPLNHINIKPNDVLSMSHSRFKVTLKKILFNFYNTTWKNDRNLFNDGKLCTFTRIKTNFYFEPYLNILTNHQHRSLVTKLRISAHKLKVEIGRYKKIP